MNANQTKNFPDTTDKNDLFADIQVGHSRQFA
jgi:hypothetical protein